MQKYITPNVNKCKNIPTHRSIDLFEKKQEIQKIYRYAKYHAKDISKLLKKQQYKIRNHHHYGGKSPCFGVSLFDPGPDRRPIFVGSSLSSRTAFDRTGCFLLPQKLNWALRGDEAAYYVSRGQQWSVHSGTESVQGGAGSFLMVLSQYRACMPLCIEISGDLVCCYRSLTKWCFSAPEK